jgi:hypothetical protein
MRANSILFTLFLSVAICFPIIAKTTAKKLATHAGFSYDEKIQKEFQEKLILVEDGGTVEFPEGKFLFKKALSIRRQKKCNYKRCRHTKNNIVFPWSNRRCRRYLM